MVSGQRHDPFDLTSGKIPGIYCAGGWLAPWTMRMGAEHFVDNGIRSADRPTRSESLCRLNYSGPSYIHIEKLISDYSNISFRNFDTNLFLFVNFYSPQDQRVTRENACVYEEEISESPRLGRFSLIFRAMFYISGKC
jgi:hypothetical protein